MISSIEMLDDYIEDCRDKGWTIDQIKHLGGDGSDFYELLEEKEVDFWPDDLSYEEWSEYVDRRYLTKPHPLILPSTSISGKARKAIAPSTVSDEAWPVFKRHLFEEGLNEASVANIERSAFEVLNYLETDTRKTGPVKGLVFGSVQSGKTAVMESLISAAADNDFNLFIILSGSIEALRLQTEARFKADLKNSPYVDWNVFDIGHGKEQVSPTDLKLDALGSFIEDSRYVTVCLKQVSRLRKLIDWLYSAPALTRRMRVIVIDDEADQASVNTAKILEQDQVEEGFAQDRRAINRLVTYLVNGRESNGRKPLHPLRSINYIAFTATPYANVLNERPGESLYPKDFVHSLQNAKEYFGVEAIFGDLDVVDSDGDESMPGLNIVREIPKADDVALRDLHKEGFASCPTVEGIPSLHRSIAWFLCCAAVLRLRRWKKPVSMLIHTSSKISDQSFDYEMVSSYLQTLSKGSSAAEFAFIESVYEREKKAFTFDDLAVNFSQYGLLQEASANRELPIFGEVAAEIKAILSNVGHIKLDDDNQPQFSDGLTICLDNYCSNRFASEGECLRVIYPTKEQLASLAKAPVFIVLGGNTLSRGLTLEGLVCSYFARNVTQADTLMQMARWFGYRQGYETLQRIWLTRRTWEEYRALAKLEYELKSELKHFQETGQSPEKLGVKVSTMPEVARFKITAKNKMQSAAGAEFDFAGCTQEVTEFDESSLAANNQLLSDYLADLDTRIRHEEGRNATIWRGERTDRVLALLDAYQLCETSGLQCTYPVFRRWLSESADGFDSWTVAVAGKESADQEWALSDGTPLRKIERSRFAEASCIDIGSLRSGSDAICDISEALLETETARRALRAALKTRSELPARRAELGFSRNPLLLIYCIDRHSKAPANSAVRIDLNTPTDILSFALIVPGDKRGSSTSAVWIPLS